MYYHFRKIILIAAIISAPSMSARAKNLGVGVIIGNPTGFSVKKWLSVEKAIDGAVAWSLNKNKSFRLHSDYLWHNKNGIMIERETFDVFYGVGGSLAFTNGPEKDIEIGVRIPFGVAYIFDRPKIEAFIETALFMNVIPSTDINIDLALGGRFYF